MKNGRAERHAPTREERRGVTRRDALKFGAAGAAAVGLATSAQASGSGAVNKKQFLLDRLCHGRNEDMSAEYDARGYMGFLDWQLAWEQIDDSAAEAQIRADYPELGDMLWDSLGNPRPNIAERIAQVPAYYANNGVAVKQSTPHAVILPLYRSRRQLQYTMAAFFQNMHNTYILQPVQFFWWHDFFRDSITKNALGSYVQLVQDSGQGGSMLWYLDQYTSSATKPNENYARELQELHTVSDRDWSPYGIGIPTFSEADIVPVAEILTGWDMHWIPSAAPAGQFGRFKFTTGNHKGGNKTVPFLNKTYPDFSRSGAGEGEGLDLIQDLVSRVPPAAAEPAHALTALHVSYRLIEWFLGPDPIANFWNHLLRVAVTFINSAGDMKATVRTLFDEQYFDDIRPGANSKIRQPLNLITALFRIAEPGVTLPSSWALKLYNAGQLPSYQPSPKGYDGDDSAWTNSLLPRFDFIYDAIYDLNGVGLATTTQRLNTIFPVDVPLSAYAQRANVFVFDGCLTNFEVNTAQAYLNGLPDGYDLKREALIMCLSSPSFQYLA